MADCDKFKLLRENSEDTVPLSLEEQKKQGNIFFLCTRTNCSHCPLMQKNTTTSPFQVSKSTGAIAQTAIPLPCILFQQVTAMKSSRHASYFLYLLWDKSVLWLKCLSLLPAGPACSLCLNFCVVLYALEPSCVAVRRYSSSSTSDCGALCDGWRGGPEQGKRRCARRKVSTAWEMRAWQKSPSVTSGLAQVDATSSAGLTVLYPVYHHILFLSWLFRFCQVTTPSCFLD